MSKLKYQRRESTHDWQELRPLLKDPAQISYEIICSVILFGMTPKERAQETGHCKALFTTGLTSSIQRTWQA